MELTAAQQQAIRSVDQSAAIIAGAGSGKTEVLTGRLLYLLKEKGLNLSQILCVTFTEKAALEMKHRIARNVDAEIKKELPWAAIGTFHGVCLGILQEQAALLGLPPRFSVWDEPTAKLEIHRACRQVLLNALEEKNGAALLLVETMEFRQVLLLLEELMQFRWHWERWTTDCGPFDKAQGRLRTTDPREETLLKAAENLYAKTLWAYEEKKSQRQALDFQDLEILTLKLLKENKEVRQACQNRFQHILVDEAQDINDCQQELLKQLWNPAKNKLCIVGDPKQSIYRFRGANVEGFQKMAQKIEQTSGHRITLQENFRSRPDILHFTNHLFGSLMDPQIYAELKPTREKTGAPSIDILKIDAEPKTAAEARRKTEAEALAQMIQAQVTEGKAVYGDFALLFQFLTEVRHYEAAFRQLNIPCRLFGGRGFLSAQEVLDCLFVLKILEAPNDRLAAAGLMRSPFLGWPDTKITELCLENRPLLPAICQQPDAAWLQKLAEEKENLGAAEILERAILAAHYDLLLDRLDPSGGKLANVEQLITLVRELETGEQMLREEILGYFETLKKRNAPMAAAPAVDTSVAVTQLMTVHQAKGLQFPIVILPDLIHSPPQNTRRYLFSRKEGLGFCLREDETPFSDFVPSETIQKLKEKESLEDLNERKRLLYVAMTRAQEKLVIPLQENFNGKAPWHQWLKEALETARLPIAKREGKAGAVQRQGEPAAGEERWEEVPLVPQQERIRYLTVTDLESGLRTTDYGLRTEEQTREGKLSGTDLGNIVHAVMKNIHQASHLSLEKRVEKEALNLGLRFSREELAEIARMLPAPEKGFHEFPFRLKMGSAVITGTIDFFFETKEGLVICDFKTNRKFQPEAYKIQMDTYALALAKAQKKPVAETQLLYLRLNKKHVEKWDAARQKRAEAKLKELTRE